ncbi:MAG: phosphoglucosamine mutase, partial [Mycobacteriales bacterium]
MARLFGTDGIRGLAFGEVLTEDLTRQVAAAAVRVLGGSRVVLGRDTRPSGPALEKAAVEGFTAAGADVVLLGVVPTPAVAQVVAAGGADLGVMLSASHNPMPDNGIKLFAKGGHKLPDEVEDAVETAIAHNAAREWTRPVGAGVGRISDHTEGAERYLAHLLAGLPTRLDGLKVVVD